MDRAVLNLCLEERLARNPAVIDKKTLGTCVEDLTGAIRWP